MGNYTPYVARQTRNATAQRVLARDPRNHEHLAENPALCDEVFAALWPSNKTPMPLVRTMLTQNPFLTDGQFAHIMSVETRGSVLVKIVESPQALSRYDRMLTSRMFTKAASDKIVNMFPHNITTDWLRKAAEKVQGRALLELWLRAPDEFTDEDIAEKLLTFSSWGPTADPTRLHWLLSDRPALVSAAARSDSDRVRTVAAGCRHLTRVADQLAVLDLTGLDDTDRNHQWVDKRIYTLLALANNPVVGNDVVQVCDVLLKRSTEYDKQSSAQSRLQYHPDPVTNSFETEPNASKLAWLLRRSLPKENFKGFREHDLPALLSNPNLGYAELVNAYDALSREFCLSQRVVDVMNDRLMRSDDLRDREPLTSPGPLPAPVDERREPCEFDPEAIEKGAGLPVGCLTYNELGVTYLDTHLGDSDALWQFALGLLEHFDGTFGDFVATALVAYE